MKYSIIIPVYNSEKYLKKCVDSVLNQTYKNLEIIIIDDGSTDNSGRICDQYSKRDKRIKVLHQKNAGQSAARNKGISMASGKYIFLVDSDDYLDVNIISFVNKKIIEDSYPDIIRISKAFINEKGEVSKDKINEFSRYKGDDAFIKIRKNKITLETPWSYLISREYWQRNNFTFSEDRLHEDLGLIPYVILKANIVSSYNTPPYYYVERQNSTITNKKYSAIRKRKNDLLYHYDYLVNATKNIDVKPKSKQMLVQYITDALIGGIKYLNTRDSKQFIKEIKKRKVIENLRPYSIKTLAKKIYYKIILYYKTK